MQLIAQESPVDVCLVIKQRLEELGLEQKDLAAATEVTESYISQLLTRKKLPPAPGRTDIYGKMAKFLKLPSDKLSKLADLQRMEELKRDLGDPPAPLFHEVRELILRKCAPDKENKYARFLRNSPSANSNASSHKSFRTSSRESQKKNWKVKTGFTWWLDSAAEAMKRCVSSFLSF